VTRPVVSVVIPTFNRLDRIARVLDAFGRQTIGFDQFEIIVVCDGSTDGTEAYLKALTHPAALRPIFQSNRGPAAARNAGAAIAEGEFIVFVDDDVVPGPRLLEEHLLRHRASAGLVAVIGPLLTPTDFRLSPWVAWEQAKLERQYDAMLRGRWEPTARQFYTGNASIRRDVFLDLGGFDEHFRRAEEVEFAYRLAARGGKFIFTMAAEGVHYAERSFTSWLDIAASYGRHDAVFARDRGQTWLYESIRWEFGVRRLPLRLLTKACLGRPRLSRLMQIALRGVATTSGAVGYKPAEMMAYSGLFGVRYYQAFLDESGMPEFLDGGRDTTPLPN